MPRASSILSFPAVFAIVASAHAIELPVIVNGEQFVQANKTQPETPPAAGNVQLPKVINYPSAANAMAQPDAQKSGGNLPVIVNQSVPGPRVQASRVAIAYNAPVFTDYMTPVAYNAYRWGPALGAYAGTGGDWYSMFSPYSAGLGSYGGFGFGGFGYGGYGYGGYGASLPVAPWGVGWQPPLVNVLDTGVRANIGHLASVPSVAAPVFGDVIGIYYR